MKSKKTLIIIVAIVVIIGLIIGINIYQSSKEPEVIKIGAILPLTGEISSYGTDTRKAIELAKEEVNLKGGVNGKKVSVIFEDSKGSAQQAITSFNKLVDIDKVLGVLGPITSAEVLSISPIANSKKIPIISPSATSPEITKAGDYVFRTINSDKVETELFAKYVKNELGISNVGIIALEAEGTISYANSFEKYFNEAGGVIVHKAIVSEKQSNFRNSINKVLKLNPEAVYVAGYSKEIGQIVKQIREINNKVILLSYQSAEDKRVVEIAGKAVDGLIFSSTTLPENVLGEKHKEFVLSFKEKFGKEPGIFTAEIYDAFYILIDAVRKSSGDNAKIVRYLAKTSNFQGASGEITFDQFGDVYKNIAIYKYDGINIKLIQVLNNRR